MVAAASATIVTAEFSVSVDVQIACADTDIPDEHEIQRCVQLAVRDGRESSQRDAEVVVRIVDTDEIRNLNDRYRHKDNPTNVLSFPAAGLEGLPADEMLALGDIVVCASVVSAEAAEQGKAVADHWAHMLVHGTLHLLGLDHESDLMAAEMEGLEIRILAKLGITDPYETN